MDNNSFKNQLDKAFEAEGISVSEDLIAKTLNRIKELEAKEVDSEENKITEIVSLQEKNPAKINETEAERRKKKNELMRMIRIAVSVAAAVVIGAVGLSVVNNSGSSKADMAMNSTQSFLAASTDAKADIESAYDVEASEFTSSMRNEGDDSNIKGELLENDTMYDKDAPAASEEDELYMESPTQADADYGYDGDQGDYSSDSAPKGSADYDNGDEMSSAEVTSGFLHVLPEVGDTDDSDDSDAGIASEDNNAGSDAENASGEDENTPVKIKHDCFSTETFDIDEMNRVNEIAASYKNPDSMSKPMLEIEDILKNNEVRVCVQYISGTQVSITSYVTDNYYIVLREASADSQSNEINVEIFEIRDTAALCDEIINYMEAR